MKKLLCAVGCLLILNVLATAVSLADEIQFKLSLSGSNLIVSSPEGKPVTSLPLATIGKTVLVPPVSFQVSYGRDAHGNYSAVISPNPEQASSLSFEIVGSKVSLDKNSIVTTTFSKDTWSVTLDPGFVGDVKIDGRAVTSSSVIGSSASTAKAGSNTLAMPVANPTTATEPASEKSDQVANSPTTTVNATPASESSTEGGGPTVALASEFKSNNPKAKLVPLDPAKQMTQKELDRMRASNEVAEKQVFWAEPVTPPDPSQALAIAPTEMKLTEVKGDVKVLTPQGKTIPAKEGLVIDSKSQCVTGENSSVAILVGGVDSVRLTASTTAAISSGLDNGVRSTVIDLKEGIVFNKVGQRDGEKQDFKVKTAVGVASARGTDYSTLLKDGRLVVLCVQGAVECFDNANKLIGTAAPREARTLSYVAVGGDATTNSSSQKTHDILAVLASAFQVNGKVNALLDSISKGHVPTLQEQSYLKKVAVVDLAIVPIQQNAPLLLTTLPHQMPTPAIVAASVFGPPLQTQPISTSIIPDPTVITGPTPIKPPLMTPF